MHNLNLDKTNLHKEINFSDGQPVNFLLFISFPININLNFTTDKCSVLV